MGGLREASRDFLQALGADLAGRRPDPRGIPAAHPALAARDRGGLRLSVLPVPRGRRGAARRTDARHGAPRRLPGRRRSATGWARRHAGKGYMTAAVRAAAGYAFETLRLRRIEAACVPYNAPRCASWRRSASRREGYRPAISVHQRRLAGPPPLRLAARRFPRGHRIALIRGEETACGHSASFTSALP